MRTTIVDKFWGGVASTLAPASCALCRVASATPLCDACAQSLPWNNHSCERCALPLNSGRTGICGACLAAPPPQNVTWTALRYDTPVVQQIVRLKFHGDLAPARLLAWLMARELARRAEPLPDVLIPVPLHNSRLRERGYNQALEIGRQLTRYIAVPLDAHAMVRRRATREQTELAADDRRRNVRGAFMTVTPVSGKHIALLDDVVTTGATAAELARTASKAGARRIEVWAVARA